jgi:hypothetical protein
MHQGHVLGKGQALLAYHVGVDRAGKNDHHTAQRAGHRLLIGVKGRRPGGATADMAASLVA